MKCVRFLGGGDKIMRLKNDKAHDVVAQAKAKYCPKSDYKQQEAAA